MKKNVVIFVLLLVIGFASVSTALFINNKVNIGVNEVDYDVIFTEAKLNDKKADGEFLIFDKKKIVFETEKLENVGDKSRLDYKVKNNSTQYGANVVINCNNYGNEYVKVEGEFDGNSFPIETPIEMEAQEIKEGHISAELIKSYVGEDDAISIKCEIVANATEKEEVVDYQPVLYVDDELNGTDPVLKDKLVPVTIANDGTVTYANVEEKWYDYKNKEWANAIILIDNPSKEYKMNDIIMEDDIQSYFVWVPRFRYQLFHTNQDNTYLSSKPSTSIAKEIQIEFENKNIEVSNGTKNGEWLTHPAFVNFDVNGLWIGKFETGYNGATSKEAAQVNEANASKVIVKPNVYSWRNSTVSNMFKTAYNYNRELDSHMMKNTEWGAVAYLSHSKYGINTEININNNSNYLTGYSAVEGTDQSSYPGTYGTSVSVTLPYNTKTGYKATTTGNITGIYDMSGGAYEYLASYMDGYGDKLSGFSQSELNEYDSYFDKYTSNLNFTSYSNRILGDATGEMGPFYYYTDKDNNKRYHNNWYADLSHFVDSVNPWFDRGGPFDDGVLAGQFHFHRDTGANFSNFSSRLVLAV